MLLSDITVIMIIVTVTIITIAVILTVTVQYFADGMRTDFGVQGLLCPLLAT